MLSVKNPTEFCFPYGTSRHSSTFTVNFPSNLSKKDPRHLRFNRAWRNVEFALHPQHEAFCDFEMSIREDFNHLWNGLGKRIRGLPTNSLQVVSPKGLDFNKNKSWNRTTTKNIWPPRHCHVYLFDVSYIHVLHIFMIGHQWEKSNAA